MHTQNGVNTLTLYPEVRPPADRHEAQPVPQIQFFVELESNGEIWKIISPVQISALRVVQEMVVYLPHLESEEDWILFNHNLDLPLEPGLSLKDNEIREGELLGLIYIFTSI